jgi:hypothetical protein
LISDNIRELIECLLLERISLRGICGTMGVGLKWLLGFLAQCFEALPEHLYVQPVTCHGKVLIRRLAVEEDDMSSFVQKQANQQWIWIAMQSQSGRGGPSPDRMGRQKLKFVKDFLQNSSCPQPLLSEGHQVSRLDTCFRCKRIPSG